MSRPVKRFYEFAQFRLDATERVLLRDDVPVSLPPKVFDTLFVLVLNAGHIVEKEELLKQVWPDTFVEEGNLSVNICALRRALGEGQNDTEFIETIARRGYRFAVPLNEVIEEPTELVVQRRSVAHVVSEQIEEIIPARGPSEEITLPAPHAPTATLQTKVWWQRARVLIAFGVVAAIAAAGGTAIFISYRPGEPVRVSLSGNTVFAWDAKGRQIWQYEFSEPVLLEESMQSHPTIIADLDGDGQREVLLQVAIPPVSVNVTHSALYCFSSRGKLLWRYDPDLKFRFGDREFSGPWNLTALEIVPEGRNSYVWAAFRHQVWWPSFVVRIDPRGGAEVRFLNAGHIYFLGTIQNTSGNYVLVAGTNNEYDAAVLALLRTDQPFSWSPQSPDSPYWCRDCGAQFPFQYYLMPRSEMFVLQHQLFHQVVNLDVTPEVIRITTFEGNNPGALPNSTSLFAYYEFNRNFELVSGVVCDSYWSLHRTLEKESKINHPAAQCPDQTLGTRVRVWIPHFGWSTPQRAALQARNGSSSSEKRLGTQ